MLDQLPQCAARLHDLWRQLVHFDIAAVVHHDACLRVEHAQALRHVVEGIEQPVVLRAQAAMQNDGQRQSRNAYTREQGVWPAASMAGWKTCRPVKKLLRQYWAAAIAI